MVRKDEEGLEGAKERGIKAIREKREKGRTETHRVER